MDQIDYIDAMLDRFKLKDVHPEYKLYKFESISESPRIEKNEMEQKLGVLQYLSCRTRPDLAYIVGRLTQEIPNSTIHLRKAVNNVFRYIKGTRNLALTLGDMNKEPYVIFVDASHGQETKSRSRSGSIIKMFGSTVYWCSIIQPIQALSTAEAELNALASTIEELSWLNPLVSDYGIESKPTIKEDNQAVLSIISQPRTKKYKLRADFIKDRLINGEIKCLDYVPTGEQAADLLTKVINKKSLELVGLSHRSICHRGMLMYWHNHER